MKRTVALRDLLPDIAGVPAGLNVSGLVQDSREVEPGVAFVALPPVKGSGGAHGLTYAAQAVASGAAAVLFEPPAPAGCATHEVAVAVPGLQSRLGDIAHRFHGEPSTHLRVVGVTGTNGKTSVVQLLAQAWQVQGLRSGTIGTLGAGLYGRAVPTGFTTPQVLQLHCLLGEQRDAGAQAVAMEVSSHALDQGRVDGVRFDAAVFTNLTRDHLDYHGDMAQYGETKARLFAWPGLRACVINLDDPYGRQLQQRLHAAGRRVLGLSSRAQPGATLRAEALRLDPAGLSFELALSEERAQVSSPLMGRFNVDNLLAVAGVLVAQGDSVHRAADTLSRLQPVHGRMNRLGGTGGRPLVVIDYAHTPDALEQALRSLREHGTSRLICVFGCGGERDAGKRPQMAAVAEAHADRVIVTDDNPRREPGDGIVADIMRGFVQPARVIVRRDRAAAIAQAIGEAYPEDIVLVAGKGHEPYQEINGVKHPFDDTDVARRVLEACA